MSRRLMIVLALASAVGGPNGTPREAAGEPAPRCCCTGEPVCRCGMGEDPAPPGESDAPDSGCYCDASPAPMAPPPVRTVMAPDAAKVIAAMVPCRLCGACPATQRGNSILERGTGPPGPVAYLRTFILVI